jgi:hypothetical protein
MDVPTAEGREHLKIALFKCEMQVSHGWSILLIPER